MTDQQTEVVHLVIEDGIATLTLDSPANRNALGTALVGELLDGLAHAGGDPDVRAVVLTHTGNTFCAGADLGEALARGASVEEASAAGTEAMLGVLRTILELRKPVIARIDGHVRAGGLGLIGACDMVFAGPACSFALTEARLGLAPSVISVVLLPKMTARSSGRYYLTGETFDATVAERIGLITQAHNGVDDLDATLGEVLRGIRKASPQGLGASKELTTAPILAAFDRDAQRRAAESAALFGSDEAREGMTAFLSKRRPPWDLTDGRAP
ncbi:enoyl-CoA hydratase family protein [Gordonia polyisoprenivorans]|uniref:enoyl-CoA hydratase family protein n=1 Tax=Gordonia polyisoprenivorans TaxID=84595 RepID=UPI00036DD18A|nr:enoyl-CoA hydratase family protein [Gordonia polyisoprenivorans]MBE7192834.1 enoyl-CoA hydratase family protein [Gordonia polyisoprenivorans]UZF55050.1 enoyl-CoA hydratase family protein [Gordonia polyisoprenivorans]WCB36224.1 enoyl-CoA hydratase family protein [Gordonia polyisoprenivorans]